MIRHIRSTIAGAQMLALAGLAAACREEDPLTGLTDSAGLPAASAIGDDLAASPPVQTELQKLLAGDIAAGAYFGSAVAIEGNTALIGAESDDDKGMDAGAVYVFTRSDGVWTERQKLTARDGNAGDLFGNEVAIDGDLAVIGAHGDDDDGANSGSAYVFRRTAGGVWTEQRKLTAGDGGDYDQFGHHLDLYGQVIAIAGGGAVYVYRPVLGGWVEQQKLTGDSPGTDGFGSAVALEGATLLIGAKLDDDEEVSAGAAYVFTQAGGVWSEQQKLTASDAGFQDSFGSHVALDGSTALIAAALDDDNGEYSGSVYVFVRGGGVWHEEQKLLPGDGAAGDQFGDGIAMDGSVAVIGAFSEDDNGKDAGSAYVWERVDGTWEQGQKLMASDGATGDEFGRAIALDGGTAVIGARVADHDGLSSGSAYVYKVGRRCDLRDCPVLDGLSATGRE